MPPRAKEVPIIGRARTLMGYDSKTITQGQLVVLPSPGGAQELYQVELAVFENSPILNREVLDTLILTNIRDYSSVTLMLSSDSDKEITALTKKSKAVTFDDIFSCKYLIDSGKTGPAWLPEPIIDTGQSLLVDAHLLRVKNTVSRACDLIAVINGAYLVIYWIGAITGKNGSYNYCTWRVKLGKKLSASKIRDQEYYSVGTLPNVQAQLKHVITNTVDNIVVGYLP